MSKFLATRNKGFRMVFENKFEISVQWGPGNYCERKDDEMVENIVNFWESCSAEIAVFNNKGGFVSIGEEDMVIGWLSTDQVAKVISIVQSSKTEEEIISKIKVLRL